MATPERAKEDPRHRHEQVREAVREATLELVQDQAYSDLSVEEIAHAAGLSRSAFYFYFRDKRDLLMAVAEDVVGELMVEADRWWHGEGRPEVLIREALEGVARVYERNAALVRGATEVSGYDDEVWNLWRALAQRFVTPTAEHLRREIELGRVRELDPDATAEFLVWMMERSLYVYLGRGERSRGWLVGSMTAAWLGALYPDAPAVGRPRPSRPRSGGRPR